MTIVISIDEYIFEANGKYYGDNVGYDIVKRYADNFENIKLISRIKHVDANHLEMHNKLLPWENVNYIDVPFFTSISELFKQYSKISSEIGKVVKGCDVALVRTPSLVGFITLSKLSKSIPYGLEVVANPYEMYKGYAGLQKVQALIMHFAQKHYCKKASAIAFVTKHSQQQLYELNPSKENNTHYSSIELKKEFFCDKLLKHDFFENLSLPLKIVHVANIISGNIKGHQEVINVASRLKQKGKNVELVFAGDGPDVDYYKNKATENGIKAIFLGFIDKEHLHELLLDSDIFLFPSKSEGLPKVLIEAMAVSVPCVASNVGGIPELLPPESVFDSYDVDGMAMRIMDLASNKQKYVDNAQLMYNTALEYESSVLALRREAFYRRLTDLVK